MDCRTVFNGSKKKLKNQKPSENEVPLTISDLFRILCVQYHIVSVEYFLDKMEDYEVEEILDALPYYDSPAWDRCRLQVHAQVSSFSKKRYTPLELMHFPWDNTPSMDLPTEITQEEIESLRNKAKQFEKLKLNP